ncbi:conserved hypothetical protein [Ferroglobus placidus DSM 10642]|uniref:MobA-like NTP transferase domain-containing protein n=1 Tax=Ferroglobus placidus (strain DSM 10642 / AEDII12DO) TaxID=589924 RepID=D3S049_FERPA|nr:NTP transferase domain-containing protein [Ferroglobus placidus]ADC66112.1 conserved hypothetical protein [Ferroglobus placidus DSM 10642]
MLAVVMCGGKGSRLNFVEKPMIEVGGKKLIDFALKEVEEAGLEAIFVTSKFTKKTESYLKNLGCEVVRGTGRGYMEDLFFAIEEYSISKPFLALNSDLYYYKKGFVSEVIAEYFKITSPALSVRYEDGRPVGINVFDPFFGEQEEEIFITSEKVVLNVDTFEDLKVLGWTSTLKEGGGW